MNRAYSRSLFVPALCLMAGALLPAAPARAENAPVVAVFLMESRGSSLKADEVVSLTDYLAARLGEGGRFQIIPRDELKKRIQATKATSHKECFDSSCQIELGREMAAQYSISTGIARVGKLCLMTASVWDLRKATQIKGATERSTCQPDALIDAVDSIAAKLEMAMTGKSGPKPAPFVQPTPTPQPAAVAAPVVAPVMKPAAMPVGAGGGGPLQGKYLVLAKAQFDPSETIEIKWSQTNGSRYDWVDVVPKGTADDAAGDRLQYLRKRDGSFSVSELDVGEYEARLFQDYNTKGYNVADRLTFVVGSLAPAGPPPGLAVASTNLGLAKRVFAAGEAVEVHYFNTTGSKYDWVTIVTKGTADNTAGSWYDYLKAKDGSFTFSDLEAGEYEARIYLDYSSKGYKVADRVPFTVR